MEPKAPTKKKRSLLKISYYIALHLLSAFAVFLIITALAVKFKWTNTSGNVDINNRYFSKLAGQYGKDLKATYYFKKLDCWLNTNLSMRLKLVQPTTNPKTFLSHSACSMPPRSC